MKSTLMKRTLSKCLNQIVIHFYPRLSLLLACISQRARVLALRAHATLKRLLCRLPFRKRSMPFLAVDSIISNQACQNGRCYFLSSLRRMPLETARHPSRLRTDYGSCVIRAGSQHVHIDNLTGFIRRYALQRNKCLFSRKRTR